MIPRDFFCRWYAKIGNLARTHRGLRVHGTRRTGDPVAHNLPINVHLHCGDRTRTQANNSAPPALANYTRAGLRQLLELVHHLGSILRRQQPVGERAAVETEHLERLP